jgi:myo-inositol 2-dehydrogenase/D-chiro-inositol 1-dehydrogenase
MRVGIIGSNWGRMHIGACRAAGLEVFALCGRDANKTEAIAREEGIPRATTDVHELCEFVDLVVIASPDRLHHEHAAIALEAGRHVLCEKPLTYAADDADDLVRRVRPGLVCAVAFPFRMLPSVAAMRAREPRRITAIVRNSFVTVNDESGDFGGVSHPLDAMMWMLGGATLRAAVVDPTRVAMIFDRGELVHRASSTPGIHHRWFLQGDGWEDELVVGYAPEQGGWYPRTSEREPWAEAHAEIARRWVTAIHGGDAELPSFADGARVQRVLHDAARSSR